MTDVYCPDCGHHHPDLISGVAGCDHENSDGSAPCLCQMRPVALCAHCGEQESRTHWCAWCDLAPATETAFCSPACFAQWWADQDEMAAYDRKMEVGR